MQAMKQIKGEITKVMLIIRIIIAIKGIIAIETINHMLTVVARIESDMVELVGIIVVVARKDQVIAIGVAFKGIKEVEEEIQDELVSVYLNRLCQVLLVNQMPWI